jgi:4-hydroxy-tetrahydrodipicolinate synthase
MIVDEAVQAGVKGNVSAVANVFPHLVRAIFEAHAKGESASASQAKLTAIRRAIDSYPSHSALKHALCHFGGLPLRWVRPPLRDLSPQEAAELFKKLAAILEERDEAAIQAGA